jgi:hypothetical protein
MIAVLLMVVFVPAIIAPGSTMQEPVDSGRGSTGWLLSYKRQGEGLQFLQKNARLHELLEAGLPHYGVPWWREYRTDLPLPDGAFHALSLPPSSVTVEANRFVTVTGTSPGAATFRGLLWCDTAAEQPTLIFVFMMMHQGRAEGSASLDVYTNRDDADSPLPPQLLSSVRAWLKESKISTIDKAVVHDTQDRTAPVSASDFAQPNS